MRTKYVFFVCFVGILVSFLASCGRSTEDLTKEVRASMEQTWNKQGMTVVIKNFTLVKKSDTEYRGVLEASANGGETETLTINVTVDGDSFMWEVDQ